MRARGDLRHDAAEGRVILDLAQHDVGEDLAASVGVAAHDRRGGLVAARLDAEHRDGARGRKPSFSVRIAIRLARG